MTEAIHARYLGHIPAFYHEHLGPALFATYAQETAARVAAFAPRSVLEVACGSGITTAALRAGLPADVPLIATDLNAPMLDYARAQMRDAQGCLWRTADAAALPFADDSFDVLVCQFGLMFVPDKAAALREAARVVAPGGRVLLAVWGSLADNPFARLTREVLVQRYGRELGDFFQVAFGLHDQARLAALCADAGLLDLQWECLDRPFTSRSAEFLARGLIEGTPVSLLLGERGMAPEPVVAALARELAVLGSAQPFASSMRAFFMTATAPK